MLAFGLYALNTLLIEPWTVDRASFVHCYLGDVLCLPGCLPVALWLQRRTGLRRHDGVPSLGELLLHWGVWSLCFEWLGPHLPLLAPGAVGDVWDVVAYAGGGAVAALWWGCPLRTGGQRPRVDGVDGAKGMVLRIALAGGVALVVLAAYRAAAVFH